MWQPLPAFCFWYFTVCLYCTVAKEIEQVSNNNIKPQDCAIHIFFGWVQKLETRESNENNERIRIWSDVKQLVSTLFCILSWLGLNSSFRLESVRFEESIWIKYGNFVRRLAGLQQEREGCVSELGWGFEFHTIWDLSSSFMQSIKKRKVQIQTQTPNS